WGRVWQAEAEQSAARGDWSRAAAQAFLGHLPLSPYHERKAALLDLLRRCHARDRQERGGFRFEHVRLAGGRLAGYRETPEQGALPPVLLLPPLASTKEELAVLADPLLAAGHPVLRLDLPGQGESPSPLTPTSERLLQEALDEIGITPDVGCFVGGISLGALYALRLGGVDGPRVRGVFGISPPAIITPEQWARQEEVIWQYLDIYFATETREETRRVSQAITLDDVIPQVACPVLLYHASRDPISLPDKRERYRAALAHAPLTDCVLDDIHGCAYHLRDTIGPRLVAWCARITGAPREESLPAPAKPTASSSA
ncbi:MAG TPA: alpha/beta fold hydrolase, partial [Allosphingosinicella sp.]|nr:alpha/beta fold hydrolase [Allosphingosinicella sp.]